MNILAFDTCFESCSVAAGRGLRSLTPGIASAFEPMVSGQAERLIPMIESVMNDARLAFRDLDRLVVTTGPGTFTGSRIGVAAARAIALAAHVPTVQLSSLELMALSPAIPGSKNTVYAVATDARRGEVYLQVFSHKTLRPVSQPAVLSFDGAASALGPKPMMIAGSGAEAVAEAARALGNTPVAILANLLPDALDILFASASYPISVEIAPLYLRAPDAKPPTPILQMPSLQMVGPS